MKRRQLLASGLALGALAGCAAPGSGLVTSSPVASPSLPPDFAVRRIGIASCFDQRRNEARIWNAISANKPDFFIFGGDNVYCDLPYSLANLKRAYARAAEYAGFMQLRRGTPHMAIWDDNDYGKADGGADFEAKRESKEEFLDFWKVPAGDPRRSREGLYCSQLLGPPGRRVQIIMLDGRWFRSPLKPTDQFNAPGKERYVPDTDPAKTMLGDAQWRWLEAQLMEPAQVRLIVSGVQVVTEGHGWERWGNFPRERQRLYDLIAKTRADGVVFLSGDRHFGGFYREARGTPYPFFEMTSSGISHTWREANEASPNRVGELFTALHFGEAQIDWDAQSVRLVLKDEEGVVRRSQSLRFNELRANA